MRFDFNISELRFERKSRRSHLWWRCSQWFDKKASDQRALRCSRQHHTNHTWITRDLALAGLEAVRFSQGTTVAHADAVLSDAEMTWKNAQGGGNAGFAGAYADAVSRTYQQLKEVFVAPDLASGIRSAAYWHLLPIIRDSLTTRYTADPDVARGWANSRRPLNDALSAEIDVQAKALTLARAELDALKAVAARPGLPIVYDTNMLIHWNRPCDIGWKDVLRASQEPVTQARLVVPLRVVDELDRQKYGDGSLADRAGKALRYVQAALKDHPPGHPVPIRDGDATTLEVWVDAEDRGGDADLEILRAAASLDMLCPATGARVLTGDLGMQLRAQMMDLKVLHLPDTYRKRAAPGA